MQLTWVGRRLISSPVIKIGTSTLKVLQTALIWLQLVFISFFSCGVWKEVDRF